MNFEISSFFWFFNISVVLLFIAGFYCILVTTNLIRVLIGLELLTKGVTLLIILVGFVTGRMAFAQTLAITLIIIEVVVIAVGAGIIVSVFNKNESLDVRKLRKLKG
ncbi:MAG: NADH-quinone oxidoreductase subunit K [Armatimonadota bacterium]